MLPTQRTWLRVASRVSPQTTPGRGFRPARQSDDYEPDRWMESPQVVGVRGDGLLVGSAGADHDMSVHNVCSRARSEQPTDVRSVYAIEGHDICGWLPNESGEACLSFGLSYRLSQRGRRNGYTGARFPSAGQEHQH